MITVTASLFFGVTAMAQDGENMVNNGSFESIEKKPKRLGKIESATGWVSPTGVRADLFVSGRVDDINVPLNIYGKEDAKDGANYAGFVGFSYGDKMPRSYVMTKMNSPMKKGMKYCVKMYISLAEASKYASNNIGAIFSKKMFGTDSKVSIIEDPSFVHFENDYNTFTARYNWTEICGVYEAKGGEKYLTLGNFNSNEDTKYERMKKDAKTKDIKVQQIVAAYYYVDNVSVQLLDTEKGEECDCAISEAGEAYSSMIYAKNFTITEEMTPEEKVEIQQAYFAFGKSKLAEEGEASLNLIAEYLKANPGAKLQIMGHTTPEEEEIALEKDSFEDMDNKRIGAVMKYLMEQGVPESQMIASAKGADKPNTKEIKDSDDEEMKQAKNRRVEFQIRK